MRGIRDIWIRFHNFEKGNYVDIYIEEADYEEYNCIKQQIEWEIEAG